jgi:hypothetical protein
MQRRASRTNHLRGWLPTAVGAYVATLGLSCSSASSTAAAPPGLQLGDQNRAADAAPEAGQVDASGIGSAAPEAAANVDAAPAPTPTPCSTVLGTYIEIAGDLAPQRLESSCPASGEDPMLGPVAMIAGGGEGGSVLVIHGCGSTAQPTFELRLPLLGPWQFGAATASYVTADVSISSSPLGSASVSFSNLPDAAVQLQDVLGSLIEGDYDSMLLPGSGASSTHLTGHFRVCLSSIGTPLP